MHHLSFEWDREGRGKEQIFECMSTWRKLERREAFSGNTGQGASCLLSQHPGGQDGVNCEVEAKQGFRV